MNLMNIFKYILTLVSDSLIIEGGLNDPMEHAALNSEPSN